jgi:hypothetical protein
MEFESEILPIGNPDSGKKQHALVAQIITLQTILAAVTMPIAIALSAMC